MTDGQLLVGQTGGDPLPKTISGDAGGVSAAGGLTINRVSGTTTNDNAPTGKVGEFMSCLGSNQSAAVTITIASPGVITWTGHGLTTAAAFTLTTTGALPTGLTAGTTYYAIVLNSNTIEAATSVANAFAGTPVNTSGSQSGTQTGTASANLANAVPVDICGLQLTAGDWDIYGFGYIVPANTTTVTSVISSVSSTANTLDLSTLGAAYINRFSTFTSAGLGMGGFTNGPVRASLSGTTVYHLVNQSSFATSTATGYGGIRARRVR